MAELLETHRLYTCARCSTQVQICRHCDHGNWYCAGECAAVRRRESLRRAGARYQRTRRGAFQHAARQRVWRRRQAKVTHQGSLPTVGNAIVALASTELTTQVDHVDTSDLAPRSSGYLMATPMRLCSFCRRLLAPFARLGPLRGGP